MGGNPGIISFTASCMKIISLNVEEGAYYDPLVGYIQEQSETTDVFCFQEVLRCDTSFSDKRRTTLYDDLVHLLPDFRGEYCPVQEGIMGFTETFSDYPLAHGLAMFIKKSLTVTHGHAFIHRYRNALLDDFKGIEQLPKCIHINQPEAMQYATISDPDGATYTVANLHGIWHPGDKQDTPERLSQSKKIIDTLADFSENVIFCGDFNLMPDTESIRMIERAGYRNLITEFNIQDTRGPINHERFPDSPQYFADYAFVSKNVLVQKFEVPQLRISDHLPLELTIS